MWHMQAHLDCLKSSPGPGGVQTGLDPKCPGPGPAGEWTGPKNWTWSKPGPNLVVNSPKKSL